MLSLALAACGGQGNALAVDAPAARVADAANWRRVATSADRARLREWRTAWVEALADARGTRDGAAAIAADPALFDPDRALDSPLPPPGEYRCRTLKLGQHGGSGLGYVAYDWFRCRIGAGTTPAFAKLDGSQRPSGMIYPDSEARGVMLGTLSLGDEGRGIAYGRDRSRDVAGLVERIGERRWRVVFPYPAFESELDLIELRPGS